MTSDTLGWGPVVCVFTAFQVIRCSFRVKPLSQVFVIGEISRITGRGF